MTPQEAKTFGRTKTLKITVIVYIILVIIFLLIETRGDFANGILFFLEAILNIHFAVVLIILFGFTFLFGGIAGKEIIIHKKKFIIISIKYSSLIILAIIIYGAIIGVDLFSLIKTGLITMIAMLTIWLWSTNQMRLSELKKV